MLTQKKEGKPLRETEDMKIWKEEFKEMSQRIKPKKEETQLELGEEEI